ncbi:hypothetical protein D9M71_275120 [compost metagenome]
MRTRSTSCCQSSRGWPSRASRRSPTLRPAAWAGPFGSSSSRTGGIAGRQGVIPRAPIGSGSSTPLSQALSCSSRISSVVAPASRTPTCKVPDSPRRRTSCRLTWAQPVTALPSTETISSPTSRPARAAMLSGAMLPMTGLICWLPSIASTQKNNSASRKLATGPAATIAMRCPTGLRLKDCPSSSAGTSASRSSSIFT